ncbi:hypothetical protein PSV08DRAFT_369263 [Bipolaris maydis]|uniref:uncharacterized protein n=1 Tax=Cochliobolus heterostrophus TaxID=5016 RepID=UPI0024D5C912|nr:hypothetical protein PSV08DRAFT_369263 [Bipolaris maydis]
MTSTDKNIVLITGDILLGSRSASKGEKAVQDLQSQNLPGTVELTQIDDVEVKHGRVDVLVNNAGIFSSGDPDATDVQSLIDNFTTNAAGSFATVKDFRAAPFPLRVRLGSISTHVDKSHPTYKLKSYSYRMSKAALKMATACHHAECEGKRWKVFVFCPGPTASEMTRRIKRDAGAKPTSQGTAPLVGIVNGERDADTGKFFDG